MNLPTLYFCASSRASTYFQPSLAWHTAQVMSATTCQPVTSWRFSERPTRTLRRSRAGGEAGRVEHDRDDRDGAAGLGGATRVSGFVRERRLAVLLLAAVLLLMVLLGPKRSGSEEGGEPAAELGAEDVGELLSEGTSEVLDVLGWRGRRVKGSLNAGRR
ncbi:hypothetical protein BN1723_009403 [Verticillium longisporum]|uniref:Uncharacterized protein n=1 Tax=Verticillium longisporum TaxID=100787 RepID=A0A0G4KP13_VERLO|nr:hypothetical protein BN1723_009403 [Verticillium longisporum]